MATLLSGLLGAALPARGQSPSVDCFCLASLPELHVSGCTATIPDVCALSMPCWRTPLPLLCSQTPLPGTVVGPGTHAITVVFTDFFGLAEVCQVSFLVTPPPGGCGPGPCVPPPPGMVARRHAPGERSLRRTGRG